MTLTLLLSLTGSFALLAARARCTATECALLSTSSADLDEAAPSHPEARAAFQRIREAPERVTLALRTCANVCALIGAPLGTVSIGLSISSFSSFLADPAFALALGCLATLLVALAFEFFARTLALSNPACVTLRRAQAAERVARLVSPCLDLAARLVRVLLGPLGVQVRLAPPRTPLEELERLLAQAATGPDLSAQAPRLIHNIFEMGDCIARDIAVPRTQVVAIDVTTPPTDILRTLSERGHSRLPVYRGSIDNIVGILHTRDLVPMLQHPELIVIEDVLRPALFAPWSQPVGDLLRVMQKKRVHLAIVVDEYGGVWGVATLEDLLATIVGEIRGEYEEDDDAPPDIEDLGEGAFLIQGQASIERVEEQLGVRFECVGSFETMAGMVSSLLGCIPEAGERLFVGGCELTVEARTARCVTRLRCQRLIDTTAHAAG
ncbi:MAG: hemolysin family protein [Myxococcales bacterium]|jgi:CBS domain containing-hemolysin-like protein|nr:hemolysin family protein [Myxococcales bacterium]